MSRQPALTQADLFIGGAATPGPAPVLTTARSLPRAERKRLTGQNAAILARLEQGAATNHELAALSLKYTSRLSDLRAAGYRVVIRARDHATGCVVYALDSAD